MTFFKKIENIFGFLFVNFMVGMIVYSAFTYESPDPNLRSSTSRAFLQKAIEDFCRNLAGGASCRETTVNGKTALLATARFGQTDSPSIAWVRKYLQENGWDYKMTDHAGQEIFCKTPYFATYEIRYDFVAFVTFGTGERACTTTKEKSA